MKNIKDLTQVLEEVLSSRGFYKTGKAFFKVQAETILCCIQFQKEGMFFDENSLYPRPHYTLELGLDSLYSELDPARFTSSGCIPRYYIVNLIGERFSEKDIYHHTEEGIIATSHEITPEEQIQILIERGFSFIESLSSQDDLLQAMIQLDMINNGRDYMHGLEKFAPLLYVEKYEDAGWIARNRLWQWQIPSLIWNDPDQVLSLRESDNDKQTLSKFCRYIKLADSKDRDQCLAFLHRNYEENVKRLRRKSKKLI